MGSALEQHVRVGADLVDVARLLAEHGEREAELFTDGELDYCAPVASSTALAMRSPQLSLKNL